ncbi:serine/threonine protein kinase [Treponema sp. R8-4-B8]
MVKNLIKWFWLIALVTIIGFSLFACSSDNDRNSDDNGGADLFIGTWADDGLTLTCTGSAWNAEMVAGWSAEMPAGASLSGTCSYYRDGNFMSFTETGGDEFGTASVSENVMTLFAYRTIFTLIKEGSNNSGDNTIIKIEMVSIPAGTFMMGSPTNEPGRYSDETQHSVTLTKSFSMGKYEVTQEQYQAVMGSNPSYYWPAVTGEKGTPGKLPVETVSWYDALVFCNKLSMTKGLTPAYSISGSTDPAVWGTAPTSNNATWNAVVIVANSTGYRLPTEAQWEYACRAGTTTAYNTGDTFSDNTVWYSINSGSKTHQVGLSTANAWALYDMHGNVWELCWDRYGDYTSGSQTDPMGASSGSSRVMRGGSWLSPAGILRSAYRRSNDPSVRSKDVGFRLVRPVGDDGGSDIAPTFPETEGTKIPGATLADQLTWLHANVESNTTYNLELKLPNETISPQNFSYSDKSDVTINLNNNSGSERIVAFSSNGDLLTVDGDVTLVLNENVTLRGRNGNTGSVVEVKNGGKLIINDGVKITGNTKNSGGAGVGVAFATVIMNGGEITGNMTTVWEGGGVRVAEGSTFIMNGGKIHSNTANDFGGGLFISKLGGTDTYFIMNGGEIYNNTAMYGGGVSTSQGATFRMIGGTIYGSNAPEGFKNIATSSNAALYRYSGSSDITQYGTFINGTWTSNGNLGNSNNTIKVVNGVLQP